MVSVSFDRPARFGNVRTVSVYDCTIGGARPRRPNPGVLYQGTASAVPKAQSSRGFSPRTLQCRQVRKTVGELLGRIHESGLYRVRGDVFPVLQEALLVRDPLLGEAALPNLP